MNHGVTIGDNLRPKLIASVVAACFAAPHAVQANPVGASVAVGQASFATQGSTLSITNSPGAVINWQGFSINAGETTRFIQQSAASSVLNRVLGADPSVILGNLQSNGKVFLINPAGIMVGQGARIDVAGFVASTLNLSNQDFANGRLNFQSNPLAGSVTNAGLITTPEGGSVFLVAPNVANTGVISAQQGEVILAAGNSVQLVDTGTPGVRVEISATEGNKAENLGTIIANSGKIGVVGALVRNSGRINADQVTRGADGRVFLRAKKDVTIESGSVITASGERGGEISIQAETGTALVSGRVEATGSAGQGGSLKALGQFVGLTAASLDASGSTGGGSVLVGGDAHGGNAEVQNAWRTFVGSDVSIKADATSMGDGGKVIVWADDTTRYYGSISARGGVEGGNGGFVETSGKQTLAFRGTVDTSAPKGSAGSLLLDPQDITIVNGSGGANDAYLSGNTVSFAEPDTTTDITISETALEALTGNVTLQASRDVIFSDLTTDSQLNMTGVTSGNTFTITATRDIIGTADVNDRIVTSGGAVQFSTTNGQINIGGINTNGGNVTLTAGGSGNLVVREIKTTPTILVTSGAINLTAGGVASLGGGHIDANGYLSNSAYRGNVTINAGGALAMQNGTNIYANELNMTAVGGITNGTASGILTFDALKVRAFNSGSGNVLISHIGTNSVEVSNLTIAGAGIQNTAAGGSIALSTSTSSVVLASDIKSEGAISVSPNSGNVTIAANVVIDSNIDNTGNSGGISLTNINVSANALGRSLTLDSQTASGNAGNIQLGSAGAAAGSKINQLIVNMGGTTAGQLTLTGDILLDAKGASGSDAAVFQVTGGGGVIIATNSSSLTIDTLDGTPAAYKGGLIDFGTSQISATASGKDLILDSSSLGTSGVGGNISLALVGNSAGNYLNSITANSRGDGATANHGAIRLNQDINTNHGIIDLRGNVVVQNSITLKTNQSGVGAGNISLATGSTDTISADIAGRDLVLNTSETTTPGLIETGLFNSQGGAYLNDLSINTGGSFITNGNYWKISGDIYLGRSGADTADLDTFTHGIVVNGTRLIDTEQGNTGNAGAVYMSGSSVHISGASANTADLTINTATTAASSNGGEVRLGEIKDDSNTLGRDYLRSLTVDASGTSASGNIYLYENVKIKGTTGTGIGLAGNIITYGSDRTIEANVSSYERAITLSGTINSDIAGRTLTIDAGNKAVTVSSVAGGSFSYGSVAMSGGSVSAGAVTASGVTLTSVSSGGSTDDITLTGALTTSGNVVVTSDDNVIVNGGSIAASGSASVTATNGAITNPGGGSISAATTIGLSGTSIGTSGNRVKVVPGSGQVTATAASGGVYLEQSSGNLLTSKYTLSLAGNGQGLMLATSNGSITTDSFAGFNANTANDNWTFQTGGTSKSIVFNSGTTVDAASLTLAASGSGSATFNTGTVTLNAPVTSTAIPLSIGGATVNFNGLTNSINNLSIAGGALQGTGDVTVNANGTFSWTNGAVTGSGTLTTQTGVATTLSPGFAQTVALKGSRVWDNYGTVTFTPNVGTLSYFQVDDTVSGGTAVFNNKAGGLFDINAAFTDTHITGVGTFNNYGELRKSLNTTIATTKIAPEVVNQTGGAININSGTLQFEKAAIDVGGNYTLANNATLAINASRTIVGNISGNGNVAFSTPLSAGPFDQVISGDYNITGATTANFSAVGTSNLTFNGTVSNIGSSLTYSGASADTISFTGISSGEATGFANLTSLSATGGAVTLKSGTSLAALTSLTRGTGSGTLNLGNATATGLTTLSVSGGTLTSSAAMTVGTGGSGFTWTGGTIGGSGLLTTNAGVSTALSPATATALLSRDWDNYGTVTYQPNSTGTFSVDSGFTLTNKASTGIFDINSANARNITGSGTINNAGVWKKTLNGTANTVAVLPTFNNQSGGSVQAQSGTLRFDGTGNDAGNFTVSSGATLGINNSRTITGNISGAGSVAFSTPLTAGPFNQIVSGDYNISGATTADFSAVGTTNLTFNGTVSNLGTGFTYSGSGSDAISFTGISSGESTGFANLTSISATGGDVTFKDATAFTGLTSITRGSGGTLNLGNSAVTLNLLTLSSNSAVLTSANNITLAGGGTFTWSAGTISGSGTLITQSTSNTTIGGGGSTVQTLSRTWNNSGTATFTPNSGSDFTLNSTFNNNAGGVFNINPTVSEAISGSATINNNGTINRLGGAGLTVTIAPALNNLANGTVDVQSGGLTISGNLTQSGTLNVASTGTFQKTGGFNNNGTLSGSGNITVGAGNTLFNLGTIRPGGTGAVGNLTVTGNLDLTGGTTEIELASTGSYDKLQATGNITLGGSTLKYGGISGYGGTSGDSFADVIKATGTLSGNVTLAQLSGSLTPDFDVTSTVNAGAGGNVTLTMGGLYNYWTGATDFAWATGTNWSRSHAPLSTESAIINLTGSDPTVTIAGGSQTAYALTLGNNDNLTMTGGTLTLGGLSTVASGSTLTFTGGTVSAAANLTVAGNLSWGNSAVMTGAGTLITTGNVTLGNDPTLDAKTWNNSGTVSWSGGTYLHMDNTSTFNNLSGGVFNLPTSGSGVFYTYNGANTGTVTNAAGGTFVKSGANVLEIDQYQLGSFNNNGNVTISGGTLNLNKGGTDTGTYDIASGATLRSSASRSFNSGISFTGTGSVLLNGGTQTFGSAYTFGSGGPSLSFTGGTISAANNLTIQSAFNWGNSAVITGAGTLLTSGNVTLANDPTLDAKTWNNSGTVSWSGGDYLHMDNTSTFNNLSGGVFNLPTTGSGVFYTYNGANTGTVTNAAGGTFVKSGANVLSIDQYQLGSFNNNGNVTISGGTLNLNKGGTDTGTYDIASGATLRSSASRSFNSGISFTGTGSVLLNGGTQTFGSAYTFGSGGPSLSFTGGTISAANNLTIQSAFNWGNSAVITGAGTLLTSGNVTLANDPILDAKTWNNSGTVSWSGGDYLHMDNTSTFNNLSGGVFNLPTSGGGAFYNYNGGGTSTVTNAVGGTFVKSGANVLNINQYQLGSFSNAGTLSVTGGELVLNASFSQTGTMNIGANTTLSTSSQSFTNPVNATIAGSGTLNLGSGTLTNNGAISPGGSGTAGTLTINGNLTLGSGGTVNLEIGGTGANQYDKLVVTGATSLNGTLALSAINGYVNNPGDSFTGLMTYASKTGTFSSVTGSMFNPSLTYGSTSLDLLMQVLQNSWIGTSGGSWYTTGNWSLGHAPTSAEDVIINDGGTASLITILGGTTAARSITMSGDDMLSVDTGANLTFSQPSTFSGSTTLRVTSGGTLNVNGTLTATNMTQSGGTTNINAATTLTRLNLSGGQITGPGNLTISNNLSDFGGGNISLSGALSVTQAVGDLVLSSQLTGSTVSLTSNSANISLGNAAVSGTTTYLSASSGTITQGASGAVVATTLQTTSGGSTTMSATGNQFTTGNLYSGTGGITMYDSMTFNIGSLTGSGAMALTSAAGFTQSGAITNTSGLTLTAAGPVTLTNTGNTFSAIGGSSTSGALSVVTSTGSLGVSGLSASGAVSLDNRGGGIAVNGSLSSSSSVVLLANGAITQSQFISTPQVYAATFGTGYNITLNNASNSIGNVDLRALNAAGTAGSTGTIDFRTSGSLAIGSAGYGIVTGGTANIRAGGPITQTARLDAITANVIAAGGINLPISSNAVDFLTMTNSGSGAVVYNNSEPTLALTGITQSGGGNVTIANNGAIATSGTLSNSGGAMLLAATGGFSGTGNVSATGSVGLFGTGLASSGTVSSTSGAITLDARTGLLTLGGVVSGNGQQVNLYGGDMAISALVNNPTGNIVVNNTSGGAVTLGGGLAGFGLSNTELNLLKAANLTLNLSPVAVDGAVNLSGVGSLNINATSLAVNNDFSSSGAVTINCTSDVSVNASSSPVSLTASSLSISAGNVILNGGSVSGAAAKLVTTSGALNVSTPTSGSLKLVSGTGGAGLQSFGNIVVNTGTCANCTGNLVAGTGNQGGTVNVVQTAPVTTTNTNTVVESVVTVQQNSLLSSVITSTNNATGDNGTSDTTPLTTGPNVTTGSTSGNTVLTGTGGGTTTQALKTDPNGEAGGGVGSFGGSDGDSNASGDSASGNGGSNSNSNNNNNNKGTGKGTNQKTTKPAPKNSC